MTLYIYNQQSIDQIVTLLSINDPQIANSQTITINLPGTLFAADVQAKIGGARQVLGDALNIVVEVNLTNG